MSERLPAHCQAYHIVRKLWACGWFVQVFISSCTAALYRSETLRVPAFPGLLGWRKEKQWSTRERKRIGGGGSILQG